MTKQAMFHYPMPEGVKAALLRLQAACRRDGIGAIRVDFHDGELSAYVRGDTADPIRYIQLINKEFYEYREVDS